MNDDIINYIQKEIVPLYKRNDAGHNIEHVNTVIKRSLEIVEDNFLEVDKNITYTIAAYHDLGCSINREKHEIISAEIFMEDEEIKKKFSKQELKIIKEGIEDHRASSDHEPRSLYGKIITVADKEIITVDNAIRRAYKSYKTGKKDFITLSQSEQISKIYNHLINKYGENGYSKVWIEDKKYREGLQSLEKALKNEKNFRNRILEIMKGNS